MKKITFFKLRCILFAMAIMFVLPITVFATSSRFTDEIILEVDSIVESLHSHGGRYTEEDMERIEDVLKSLSANGERWNREDMLIADDMLRSLSTSSSHYRKLVNMSASASCGNPIVWVQRQSTGDLCARYGNHGHCMSIVQRELYDCRPSCGPANTFTGFELRCSSGHFIAVFGQVGGNHW